MNSDSSFKRNWVLATRWPSGAASGCPWWSRRGPAQLDVAGTLITRARIRSGFRGTSTDDGSTS